MGEIAEKALEEDQDLPDTVDMSAEAFDAYFDLWMLYVSTGRKHLPEEGSLSDQPAIAMQTILELDSYYNNILEQTRKQKDEEDAS